MYQRQGWWVEEEVGRRWMSCIWCKGMIISIYIRLQGIAFFAPCGVFLMHTDLQIW
jgi:hypothetical protein